jgi:hypothetical protein
LPAIDRAAPRPTRRRLLPIALGALVFAAFAAACGNPAPSRSIDIAEGNIAVGPERTCAQLNLPQIRCDTLLVRAFSELDRTRPQHADVKSRTLHAVEPAASGSPMPSNIVVPMVVVFDLTDGSLVAVPLLCPQNDTSGDVACDTRIH